jgi:hypothetical protein
MCKEPPGGVEKMLVLTGTVMADGAKFILAFVPVIDLLGMIIWFVGFLCLTLYFLMKMGFHFFSGTRSSQKLAATLGTAAIGAVPVLDGFIPELTIQALATFWILEQEYKECKEAEAKALAKSSHGAANDNGRRSRRLSRAA